MDPISNWITVKTYLIIIKIIYLISLSHLNVEKKLTCFFGYVNKIIAYSFRYDSKNENITIYSNKTISSNGAIILKTIL